MDRLTEYTLGAQSPRRQSELLRSLEKDDEITVTLEERGGISGPVIHPAEVDPSETAEELHVQFLNFESDIRHDDHGHYTVSVDRTADGEWGRAKLTYSWTDTGRVRMETVDEVERIWHGLSKLRTTTDLSRDEAVVVSMREAGLSKQEIAEEWNCDEILIDSILAGVRRTYERAERTIDRLESSPIDMDGKTFLSISDLTGSESERGESPDRKSEPDSE